MIIKQGFVFFLVPIIFLFFFFRDLSYKCSFIEMPFGHFLLCLFAGSNYYAKKVKFHPQDPFAASSEKKWWLRKSKASRKMWSSSHQASSNQSKQTQLDLLYVNCVVCHISKWPTLNTGASISRLIANPCVHFICVLWLCLTHACGSCIFLSICVDNLELRHADYRSHSIYRGSFQNQGVIMAAWHFAKCLQSTDDFVSSSSDAENENQAKPRR